LEQIVTDEIKKQSSESIITIDRFVLMHHSF
jgi:hypothetical protein